MRAPEKNQHPQARCDPLRRFDPKGAQQAFKPQVEEDIGPLPAHGQTRGTPLLDFGSQPGVVQVTGEVSCLNPLLPNAGQQGQKLRPVNAALSLPCGTPGRGSLFGATRDLSPPEPLARSVVCWAMGRLIRRESLLTHSTGGFTSVSP